MKEGWIDCISNSAAGLRGVRFAVDRLVVAIETAITSVSSAKTGRDFIEEEAS